MTKEILSRWSKILSKRVFLGVIYSLSRIRVDDNSLLWAQNRISSIANYFQLVLLTNDFFVYLRRSELEVNHVRIEFLPDLYTESHLKWFPTTELNQFYSFITRDKKISLGIIGSLGKRKGYIPFLKHNTK